MTVKRHSTEIGYHYSDGLPALLEQAGCSVLLSTYQAGQLVGIGVADDAPVLSFRRFDRAMGIAVGSDRIAVAGKAQVWSLRDHSGIASAMPPERRYDACWLPRSAAVTGEIQCHEIAWGVTDDGQPDLWVVNTLFSCLAGLDDRYSFVPRWRPPFVSGLVPEDRCHLNGLAMRGGRPAYVTVMARSDGPAGWRAEKDHGGTVLDVASGETVTSGLCMPHSPRCYDDGLFVLNSGNGWLEHVDLATGQRDVVAAVPGYTRGLAIHDGLAFVGLSKIRETAVFGGTPIADYHDQLRCGLGVIDLATGRTLATLQFDNGVEEVFDVQVVPGVRCPTFGEGDDCWVLPHSAESNA